MRPDGEERGGLRGSASYTALPCSEPPSNPPALGLGGRRGHTRRPRELAGAVGEGATPCTDGRPSETTPAWIASHQSSLPNAAKGYQPMYVCRKVKNSQARTGHQRGMGGRWTDDDDTHERHTDTNKLTRHTASGLPHTLSWRTHNSGPHSSCRPPSTRCQEKQTRAQHHNRRQE